MQLLAIANRHLVPALMENPNQYLILASIFFKLTYEFNVLIRWLQRKALHKLTVSFSLEQKVNNTHHIYLLLLSVKKLHRKASLWMLPLSLDDVFVLFLLSKMQDILNSNTEIS